MIKQTSQQSGQVMESITGQPPPRAFGELTQEAIQAINVQRLLWLLGDMSDAQPPADLVSRTMERVDAGAAISAVAAK